MTIDDLKEIQAELDMTDVHFVWLDEDGFVIAHTDDERKSGMDLHDCPLHQWLSTEGMPDHEPGVYVVVPHEPDTYSEDYGRDPWDFELPSNVL